MTTQAIATTTPRLNKYIPHYPSVKQAAFLLLSPVREVLYGGAAGGGKSDALLMAALQYVDMPAYHALLLRRTFADLSLPGALMPRAESWLIGTDARYDAQNKTWVFPTGSTLTFGYLENERDKYRYQSSEFQYIGFDELTQFSETQYLYLFSRLRRSSESNIPLRMRSATNPGGSGHYWVKRRFVESENTVKRAYLPATRRDNPYLDQREYEQSLAQLDIVTRRRLDAGDWGVDESGGIFARSWFRTVRQLPPQDEFDLWVRAWDFAATEVTSANPDPDYTVGVLLGRHKSGVHYVADVQRVQANPAHVEKLVLRTAKADGYETVIYAEMEGGSSGKFAIDHLRRNVLGNYTFYAERSTGSKLERARPLSARAEAGDILLLEADWNEAFLQEIASFTGDNKMHDDQVDALALAWHGVVNGSASYLPVILDW